MAQPQPDRHSPAQLRIAAALELAAKQTRLLAAGRRYTGPQYTEARARLREEARRCDALAAAILAADPLELDAVVDAR